MVEGIGKPPTFQAIMYYVMDIFFGEIDLKNRVEKIFRLAFQGIGYLVKPEL